MATKTPQYSVQRAGDDYTKAQFTASRSANLFGVASNDAEADLESIINAELPDALQFIETEMGAKRAKATEYYNGEYFGNEEEGRSKVVSRDVLAAVKALLPSVMRTFFGGRRRVKFAPNEAKDVEGAEQSTEFVNKVVMQIDNNGFLEVYAAAKDALIRYKGIFKWWWDDAREVSTETYTGQDEDALLLLSNDPEITDIRVYEEEVIGDQPKTYAVIAKRVKKHLGKARFGCVPPEELLINRDARSIETARFVDHRRVMTVGELVAMGYDKDELLPLVSKGSMQWSAEQRARNPSGIGTANMDTNVELSLPIVYHEAYTAADMDGDDYPELIKACGAGDGAKFKLLHWEPVSEIPFCSIDPDPEPHALFGLAPGPNVMDIQLIKSALLRMSLDGAALALDPRLEVVEHMVELDDLLNPEIGGIVRTRAPGQIAPIRYDFNPAATQGLLEYMDQVREERTRQSRPSQGLDADAMQSSSKLAVAATLSGAQGEQEMICRLFAEGLRRLYRGLLGLTIRHATKERMVNLRGEWIAVDPRTWNSEMHVEIDVGIGVGGVEMEIAALMERKINQEAIIQLYGAENPMVDLSMYRNTLARLDELRGLADTNDAYKPVPKDWKPPTPEQPKSDAEILAESAANELELKRQVSAAELAIKAETMRLEDERERIKIANDFQASMAKIQADAKSSVDIAQFEHIAEVKGQETTNHMEVIDSLINGVAAVHEANVNAPPAAPEGEVPSGG